MHECQHIYGLTRADIEAHAGRPVTDAELEVVQRSLGHVLGDAIADVVHEVIDLGPVCCACGSDASDGVTVDPADNYCAECRAEAGGDA